MRLTTREHAVAIAISACQPTICCAPGLCRRDPTVPIRIPAQEAGTQGSAAMTAGPRKIATLQLGPRQLPIPVSIHSPKPALKHADFLQRQPSISIDIQRDKALFETPLSPAGGSLLGLEGGDDAVCIAIQAIKQRQGNGARLG
jgi:hypothetical protein